MHDFKIGADVLDLNPFRNVHWRQSVSRRGSTVATLVLDNSVSQKTYSGSLHSWTVAEAQRWNAEAVPEGDYRRNSGYEWKWERVDRPAQVPHLKYPIAGGLMIQEASERITGLQKAGRPPTPLAAAVSLRCIFCTFLHGAPGSARVCAGQEFTDPQHCCMFAKSDQWHSSPRTSKYGTRLRPEMEQNCLYASEEHVQQP